MDDDKLRGKSDKTAGRWFSLHSIRFKGISLRGKMTLALVPMVVLILAGTGFLTYGLSRQYISTAIERNVVLRDLAAASEVEDFLERCRRDVLFFASGSMAPADLGKEFERKAASGEDCYFELGYLSANSPDHAFFLARQGRVVRVPSGPEGISPSPQLYLDSLSGLKKGSVWISPVMEVELPLPEEALANKRIRERVIRFVTPAGGADAGAGLLMLSVPARAVRNILSLYDSTRSPLWSFPRSQELRFSFMLDTEGWILFQSEDVDAPAKELTTFRARSGMSGTLGRQGHPAAFRPSDKHGDYWSMVRDLAGGKSGIALFQDTQHDSEMLDEFFMAYCPVVFRPDGTRETIYGGLLFVDRSQLPVMAGYHYLDLMVIITLASIVLLVLLVYFLGRSLSAPIRELAGKVSEAGNSEYPEEIRLGFHGQDLDALADSVNAMIRRMNRKSDLIHERNRAILSARRTEPADMTEAEKSLAECINGKLPEIVGTGERLDAYKDDILKAAQAKADVLIVGETGTGKQLAAEALHRNSSRAKGQFVSINCGALDENLLLDALFGHLKGAFSEAKTDRKGAFQLADGGTLFLDEIQSASPKVQQSLLRALSVRRIKPLGSDREYPVDVRIVAATNADLSAMITEKAFREDLYYRLQVLSIHIPPLRENKDDIPVLSLHYLSQAQDLSGQDDLKLSVGALEKLMSHDWPGNIRELINAVTRAAVMTEQEVIQAGDIRLTSPLVQNFTSHDDIPERDQCFTSVEPSPEGPNDGTDFEGEPPSLSENGTGGEEPGPDPGRDELSPDFNERQRLVWPQISSTGSVSRGEYQEMAGGIPSRTAIYDLQIFVRGGYLRKIGNGPSTRYEVVKPGTSTNPEVCKV